MAFCCLPSLFDVRCACTLTLCTHVNASAVITHANEDKLRHIHTLCAPFFLHRTATRKQRHMSSFFFLIQNEIL